MKLRRLFLLFLLTLSLVLPGCGGGGGGGSSAGPAPTATPTPSPPDGKTVAVLVGVNIYLYQTPNLSECKPDALDFGSSIVGSPMWSGVSTVTTLVDAQPTKSAIQNAILVQAGTFGPQDLFVLVFSSHGSNDGGTGYLIPYDGANINSYISGEELKSWLTALRKPGEYTNICVILDSCYSGLFIGKGPSGMTSKFVPIPGSRLDFTGDDPAKQIQEMPDAVVITASKGSETSLAVPALGHSLCMNYVIEGLGAGSKIGPADTNHDGKISMSELYVYAYPWVVDYATQHHDKQTPQYHPNSSGSEVILKY